MTNCRRFAVVSAAIGMAIPLLWLILYWTLLRGNPDLTFSLLSKSRFDRLLLALWPSWILLVADPEETSFMLPVVAVALNALLYGAIGWLVCIGWRQNRAVLGLVAAVASIAWYVLFRWYEGG